MDGYAKVVTKARYVTQRKRSTCLVLSGVTDHALGVREGNVRRGRAVSLVVRDDLHTVVLPHTHARVGGAEIDT